MSRREKLFAVLPTMLTLGNAACGFGAITLAAKSGVLAATNQEHDAATTLLVASGLIFLAMLFDALDGSAARLTNQTSDFGAELDSLCDAISFGAAPGFLMLQFSRDSGYHPRLLWIIAGLHVVCAVLRLARFNVETDEDDSHDFFSGLPSPAAAGTVASFPIMVYGLKHLEEGGQDHPMQQFATWLGPLTDKILPIVTLAVACLMVSRIRYAHVFNQFVRGRRNRQHLIQLVFAVAVIFILPQLAAPFLFCWFAFASPIRALWQGSVVRWWQRGRSIPLTSPATVLGSGVPPAAVHNTPDNLAETDDA